MLWTRAQRRGGKRCYWLRTLDEAAEHAARLKATRDVYFGVCLHDPERALDIARQRFPKVRLPSVRGSQDSVVALPALWADIDIAGPGHSSRTLPPDRRAALGLLEAVPVKPTIVVHTGGGYHVYWLLHELWELETADERAAARELLVRLQGALRTEARQHGWSIDHTADLARVLRLPGTLNLKSLPGRPVRVERFPLPGSSERRYDPCDFDDLPPAPATAGDRGKNPDGRRDDSPPADFEPIRRGCAWVDFCCRQQDRVSEPEWYALLGIVGRSASAEHDSRALAHEVSRRHPGYDPLKTEQKLDHALRSPGPHTCPQIAGEGDNEERFCRRCPHRGLIKSPIVLGRLTQIGRPPDRARPAEDAEPAGNGASPPSDAAESSAGQPAATPPGAAGGARPVPILVTPREHEVNDQALAALAEHEDNLFERAGVLVHVVRPGNGPAVVRPIPEARMNELLARHCGFFRAQKKAKGQDAGLRPLHPPRWTSRALLARGTWPQLPTLEGVVECPVLRADGTVLQSPGYDRLSGLVYAPQDTFAEVPGKPTSGQVEEALMHLREVVCNFPFQDGDAHFAAWLSSLLTPLARAAFSGPSPLNLIDANVRGSGKSLLADICSTLLTGRPAARMSYSRDDDELRKAITGLALEATQLVLIDNITGAFGSPTLDRALTADTWRDRLLGSNDQVSVPLRVTWYATGNNVALAGDTPRRCLHIRLESALERPEQRTDFRHPRLLAWVGRERGRLLPAALTLLRAFVAAGRPPQELPGWGSFESWSDLVRSAVVWLGLPDPAGTREDLEAGAALEQGMLHDLVHGLLELLEPLGGSATAKEIVHQLAGSGDGDWPLLRSALDDFFPRLKAGELPRPAQLAGRLRSYRGRIVRGACIDLAAKSYQGARWTVRRVA